MQLCIAIPIDQLIIFSLISFPKPGDHSLGQHKSKNIHLEYLRLVNKKGNHKTVWELNSCSLVGCKMFLVGNRIWGEMNRSFWDFYRRFLVLNKFLVKSTQSQLEKNKMI